MIKILKKSLLCVSGLSVMLLNAGAGYNTKLEFTKENNGKVFSINSKHVKLGIDTEMSQTNDCLEVNTMTDSHLWNQCLATKPGFLKPGTTYTISFKAKVLEHGKDSKALVLIRPYNFNSHEKDMGKADVISNIKTDYALTFKIPENITDYAIQIHTKNQARVVFSPIVVSGKKTLPDKIFPLNGDAPVDTKLKTASGAQAFSIDQPSSGNQLTLSAVDFGVNPNNPDNTPALNRAIEECKKKSAQTLIVPKGIYRFTSNQAVTFKDMKDFVFDGGGSTFVFHKERESLLRVTHNERIVLKNFNIDWDWQKDPLASVVKLENIADDRSFIDVRFVDYDKFPRPDARFALLDRLDPETMSVAVQDGFNQGLNFRTNSSHCKTKWLSGNLLRIYSFHEKMKNGQLFRLSHYYYDMNGISMVGNRHLTIMDVNIFSCPGHAFTVGGDQQYWQFVRCNIIPPPGEKRIITCTADHCHISQSKGFFKMEDCEFAWGNDDCLNVHDCSAFGTKTAEREMTFTNLRDPNSYNKGDSLEFRKPDYSPADFKATITVINKEQGSYKLTFDKKIPGDMNSQYIIFNRRYDSRNIIIRNCYFHDNRARGLLILARDVTIENNRFFRNQMGALKLETGYTLNSWCEGYGVSNVLIRNNVFEYINPTYRYLNEKHPVIYMSVYLKTDPSMQKTEYPIINNITIENNKFINNPGAITYVSSAGNVIIKDNIIKNNLPFTQAFPHRGIIYAAYVNGLYVTGNSWGKSTYTPVPGLATDPNTPVNKVYSWNNILK